MDSVPNPSNLSEMLSQIAIVVTTEICKCSWIAGSTWNDDAFCCTNYGMAYDDMLAISDKFLFART